MWAHEGPWKKERKKIAISKEFIQGERSYKRSFHSIHHNPCTCTSWSDCMTCFFSLDPVFDFAIYVIQVYLILHTLPWAPHIAITRSRMKKRQVKCHGVGAYQCHQRWRPQTPIWGGCISWTTNKSASARNTAVEFYPGVYRGVIYISAGKAVSEKIYRLVGELNLDWIFSCINRSKIYNMVGGSVTHTQTTLLDK